MALVEAIALIQIPQFRFQEAVDGSEFRRIEMTVLTGDYFVMRKEELEWVPRKKKEII